MKYVQSHGIKFEIQLTIIQYNEHQIGVVSFVNIRRKVDTTLSAVISSNLLSYRAESSYERFETYKNVQKNAIEIQKTFRKLYQFKSIIHSHANFETEQFESIVTFPKQ